MPLLEQVLERNPDSVKLVHKNFPLPSHKFAMKAAIASLAAYSQGRFWEFQDRLLKDYNKLNDDKVMEIVAELDLDRTRFEENMKDPQLAVRIRKDVDDGRNAGVRGTPTVFINGRRLKNRSINGFQQAIDKELSKIQGKQAPNRDGR